METIYYLVTKIDGDYAILVPIGEADGLENPVALALLPDGVDTGTRLRWENFEYDVCL